MNDSIPRLVWGGIALATAMTLAACSSANTVSEKEQASESGSQTLPLDPGSVITLEVNNGVGNITLQTGPDDQIKIDYTKTAYGETRDKAKAELKEMTVQINAQADRVTVDGTQTKFNDHPRANQVELTITVPPTITLQIAENVGDVQIDGIRSPQRLVVSNNVGTIALNNTAAPDGLLLSLNTGDVRFGGQLGAAGSYRVMVNTGSVSLQLAADTAITIDAKTTVGTVSVSGFEAAAQPAQQGGVGASWRGTLGRESIPPTFTIQVDVGDIRIGKQ